MVLIDVSAIQSLLPRTTGRLKLDMTKTNLAPKGASRRIAISRFLDPPGVAKRAPRNNPEGVRAGAQARRSRRQK